MCFLNILHLKNLSHFYQLSNPIFSGTKQFNLLPQTQPIDVYQCKPQNNIQVTTTYHILSCQLEE